VAIDRCSDPTPLLQALDLSLERLPSGGSRTLRYAAPAGTGRATMEQG
jgi:hypothetical protein